MFGFGFGPLTVGRCLTWLHLSRLEPLSPNHTLSTRRGQENRTPRTTTLEKDFCESAARCGRAFRAPRGVLQKRFVELQGRCLRHGSKRSPLTPGRGEHTHHPPPKPTVP